MAKELSVVVPALNEAAFIETTVREILSVARDTLDHFEIIMVNDGSSDKTAEIMERLKNEIPESTVIHHVNPKGVGKAFWEGIEAAKYPYLSLIPGDNAYNIEGLKVMFAAVGQADLVITYRKNSTHARTAFRIFLSKLFRLFVIILSGHRLRDFYSTEVYPVEQVRRLKIRPAGYTYQIETIVALLSRDIKYIEIPTLLNLSETRNSQVFNWKTIREIWKLYWRLLFHKSDYSGR
jgi:dolichol-phosphate mannosyltransferase